ncbi:MAG: glycosyltransferase [Anaerolineales bacterium]|nr:glycosyltransferase [Anaerolineales bacterium]
MHILLIHQAFAAITEPGGTRHHEMARYLVEKGHRVTVITGQTSYLTGRETVDQKGTVVEVDDVGVEIIRTYSSTWLHQSFFRRVISFFSFMLSSFFIGFRVGKVDLVWGTSPPLFQGMTAWLLARLKGAPFLFEVRDLWPYFAVEVGVLQNPVIIRLSEFLEAFLYRRADRIVVNSPGYIGHVSERGGRKVDLIPNGVDTSMFDPDADGGEYREIFQADDKYVVLYAGAHGISNDLGVVIEAAGKLRSEEGVIFVLVGDGKEKPNLIELAKSMDIDNVLFQSPVPKQDISQVLAAADLCIAILKPIEAFRVTYPNKVFDYMAAGRPVLLAIDGVIREVVEEAEAGVFVPPGDSSELAERVILLSEDREKGICMGQSGRRYVEKHFDRRDHVDEMVKIFEDTIRRMD